MTPQEITDEALVPGTKSVFVLGSFERRVTVYSQQVRALNLVDAILSQGLVRETGRVAIVGGGAAGITAAVGLAKAAPQLAAIDLFETRSSIMELQRNSARYLHPHFYDWPNAGSDAEDAGLPIMNWRAGPAGKVAATLREQFEEALHSSILGFHPSQRVTELLPSTLAGVRVVAPGGPAIGRIYDVVILAIGFGLEAYSEGETPSYWTPSQLAGPIHTALRNPMLFISGNGDGGLVDFMMAALNAMEHRAICEFLMRLDLGPALAELQAIEREAWADGADVDLMDAYQTRVRPLIPDQVWADVRDQLRPDVSIRLHTKEARLLRRTTALHNRLGAFLILEADADMGRHAIQVTTNVDFAGGGVPMHGEVKLAGEAPFTPFRRFLRLGPDSTTNLAPFDRLLEHYPGRVNPPASATRPASPPLTAGARARFEAVAAPVAAPPAPAQSAQNAAKSSVIVLRADPAGGLAWSGDFGPAASEQLWTSNRALVVYTEMSVADAAGLVPAIARLGGHAPGFIVHAHDAHGWRVALSALCRGRALPGPDVNVLCGVQDWVNPPVVEASTTVAAVADIASVVQSRLDSEMLRQLRDALYEILGPPAAEMGWPIESGLRTKLWEAWERWHAILLADTVTRRRFLLLLATEQDRPDPDVSMLVRLGPKTLRPFLTKPAIFGLTFAVCSGHALTPALSHPGNVASDSVTGHACGVGWIRGRDLGARCVLEQAWTTGVVLLSQLRDAFQLIEGETRLDMIRSDRARIGAISPGEEPLVIGADDVFVSAVEAGEQIVHDYLQSVFNWRSDAARATLEEADDA